MIPLVFGGTGDGALNHANGDVVKSVGTKFFSLLGAVIIVFSGFFFYRTYSVAHSYLTNLVGQEADMALKFDIAIRKYVAEKIRPVMFELVGEDEFIPETMSTSFVARSIFSEINKDFPDFILKFSSNNPRNPANKAGPEEAKIIDYFNNNPDKKEWSGEFTIGGRKYLARFEARWMEAPCLRCHGDPADAPASLLAQYGATAAFHRPVGEVIALDTVAIPVDKVTEQLWNTLSRDFFFVGLGFVLMFFSIFAAFKFLVINRLGAITQHFVDTAGQQEYSSISPIDVKGNDEITVLAKSFNALAGKLQESYGHLDAEIKERTRTNELMRQEIAERQRAEKALRQWEHIFQNANWGVAIGKAEGAIVEMMNPAYARMYGGTVEECIGRPLADFFSPANREKIPDYISIAHEKGHYTFESEHLRADGSVFPVMVDVTVVRDEEGAVLYLVANMQDITEQKRLEEQLIHARKMEAVGKLAGGVAHDFNNILTTVMGYSEMILLALAEGDPMKPKVEAIHVAGKKAAALTNQLLAFSRKQVLALRVVDLHSIVIDMGKMLNRLLREDIELRLDKHSPNTKIKADPVQIEQILMNLAVNARDAMPDGGCLVIETDNVFLDEGKYSDFEGMKEGNYVMLSVSDTGVGMAPEVLEKIFEPFFTTKTKGKGTGLGLSTVYGIIRQHEGYIHVYSEVGKGTTFKIYFPSVDQPVDPENKVMRKALSSGKETILVVEDEPSILSFIKDTLTPVGYRILTAANGREALEVSKAFDGEIDLLLTDVIMPEMNGMQLVQAYQELRPSTKVLFMSGYTEDIIAKRGVLKPGTNFINKPLVPSVLTEKLRDVLDS